MASRRMHRVAEQLRELVATEILRFSDQRLSLVTVTFVKMTSDLKEAKVYWNVYGDVSRQAEVDAALKELSSTIRKNISKKVSLRFLPKLKFFYDNTLDTLEEVNRIMEKIESE